VQYQYEERIAKYRQDLADRDLQLEKVRQQNAELTKEMVDATNEAGQCKNEVRVLRDKLKKAQADVAQMEAALQLKDQEVADQRNEQYQLLHKNKVDSLRHSESLQT
jgi:septal ring factor EnvC (AmiA/AmiB activator)